MRVIRGAAVLLGLIGVWLALQDDARPTPTRPHEDRPLGSVRTVALEASTRTRARPSSTPGTQAPVEERSDPARGEDMATVRLDLGPLAASSTRGRRLYRVPKRALGLDGRYPHLAEPVEGAPTQFRLPAAHLPGHWICSEVEGALNQYFDGDTWNGAEVVLHIERAPLVEVQVLGVAPLILKECVVVARSSEVPGRGLHHLPGPDADRSVRWWRQDGLVPGPDGWLRKRFPTRAPVRLRAQLAGHYADPLELDVGTEGGSFSLHLRPSATLTVAPRGIRGDGYFRLSIRRDTPPHEVEYDLAKAHEAEGAHGYEQRVRDDLAPGRYTIEVEADYYQPRTVAFEVQHPGEKIRLEPRLQSKTPLGALLIEGLLPSGLVVRDPKHVGLFDLYVRRHGSSAWGRPWQGEESWQERTLRFAALPIGTYDLLLWETQEHNVGLVRGVVISADETLDLQVPLRRGRYFSMQPLAEAGLKAHKRRPDPIRVRAPELGSLPPYIMGFHGASMVGCLGGFEKALFGPFPVEMLIATYGPKDKRVEVELPPR